MRFFGSAKSKAGEPTVALGRPRTFLNVVLDASSSMEGPRDATIQAFNHFIDHQRSEQATAKDEVFVTLTVFSDPDRIRTHYVNRPLQEVARLTRQTYMPSGNTALYDGLVRSIVAMEQQVGEQARVLTLVITDGEENASREVTDIETVKQVVQTREARGNWTFVFLSAGQDPYGTGVSMGFQKGNVNSYDTRDVGTALARINTAMQDYRRGDAMQTGTFYAGSAPKWKRPEWTRTGADEDVEDVV